MFLTEICRVITEYVANYKKTYNIGISVKEVLMRDILVLLLVKCCYKYWQT